MHIFEELTNLLSAGNFDLEQYQEISGIASVLAATVDQYRNGKTMECGPKVLQV
jgi:hypothetical protein